jgi:formate C-acetyltransferase
MELISQVDRNCIENKYHLKNEPFDPFNRFAYHGWEYDEATGLDDNAMAEGLESLFERVKHLPHSLAKAKGFEYVLDNMRIDVNEHDYFVGMYNWGRPLQKPFISKWYREVFESMPDVDLKMARFGRSGTATMWLDMDHVVPNWMDIIELGFPGLLDRVRFYHKKHEDNGALTEEQSAFFESMEITYSAIIRLIERMKSYAELKDGHKEAIIAESLSNLAKGAPQTFFDVLELIYIYFMCSESIDQYQARSLGNGLDRALYAFYKKDIESGRYTRDELRSFLAYFFMQFSAIGNYWGQPFYLCGTDYDGKTDITDFTIEMLDVYEELKIYNPKIQVKIDYNTPDKLIDRVLRLIRGGTTSMVICCMPGLIKSLMGCYGTTFEEANNCDISGCNEIHIRADEACMISSLPNMAKAISYVFTNGYDEVTGRNIGLQTGEVEQLQTFDDFYEAFIKQFRHILDEAISMARSYEHYACEVSPALMLSATMERSLKSAKDAYTYGVKYPNSAILLCSFATSVDSVLAVKELVYDRKVVSLAEMKKALLANWEGYEELRQKALNCRKYGNNDEEADKYASAIYKWFSMYVNGQKNSRGGVYKVGVPSTLHFISQGKVTMATPDGRRKGEECSKNVAPVIGMERNGVTAMIHSALKCSPYMFSEAHVLDVMLHPSAVSGEEGLSAMKGLLMNYMKNDGICIQFNIFSSETLRDAQKHPEKYQNLQVRVSGWNVLWNNLSKAEQEAYIIRAESIGGNA